MLAREGGEGVQGTKDLVVKGCTDVASISLLRVGCRSSLLSTLSIDAWLVTGP